MIVIRNKKLVITFFIILTVILVSVSIAYAALSTTLQITTNKITQNAMTWDIGFATGTVTGEARVNNSNAVSCGEATATATAITGISTSLSGVGDECAYTFTIRNNGTIGGIITAINITKPTSTSCTINGSTMVCGSITYKLHYDTATSTSLVAVNNTIAPKSGTTPTTKTVVLTITHTGTIASATDFNQNGFAYNITFSQN